MSRGPNQDATLPPQIDYRNHPSTGETANSPITAPGYDTAGDDTTIWPQPDASIHDYDLDDETYNVLKANPPALVPGYSPDLPTTLAWERTTQPDLGIPFDVITDDRIRRSFGP